VENKRIPDLVEPVAAPQGEAVKDGAEALVPCLVVIDVDDDEKKRDEVPLELRRVPED
jgi:hypothetical protein